MVTVDLFMFIRVHLIQVLSIEFPYVPLHDLLTSPDMPLYDLLTSPDVPLHDLLTSPDVPLHDLLTSPDEHAGLKYATQINIICFRIIVPMS